MEKLLIESTALTPDIEFDGNNGIFKISGKSYPEDVNSFYEPLIKYIEDYKNSPKEKTILEFNWLYFNTSTSKMMVYMVFMFKQMKTDFQINWYYESDLDTMLDRGEEIKEILGVKFNIIEVKE